MQLRAVRLLARIGLAVLAVVGSGCRSTHSVSAVNQAARTRADIARVVGRVVDFGSRPLEGRVVAIGRQRVVTDAEGRFMLEGVADRYDAVVVEPDRAAASVYRGLRRRDPLLVHRGLDHGDGKHVADIVGTLSGGGSLERDDYAVVGFLSREATAIDIPSPTPVPGRPPYPAYGPLRVVWRGADTITGELVALIVPRAAPGGPPGAGGGRPAFLAHKRITLDTGFVTDRPVIVDEHNCAELPKPLLHRPPVEVPLALAPVPSRHVALTVEAPYLDSLTVSYKWPALDAELSLPSFGPTHERLPARPIPLEADVPDLGDLGATLCVQAVANDDDDSETCTFPQDAPATVRPRRGPSLSMPPVPLAVGGQKIFAPTTRPSWMRFDGGVQMLGIEAQFSSAEHPSVYVFTEDTSASWPDLASLGVRFPADFVMYHISVTGFGPYSSLDDALAPDGIGAATLSDRYWASAQRRLDVMLSPTGAPLRTKKRVRGSAPTVHDPPPKPCYCGRD